METTLPQNNPTKIATKWALINLLTQIIITYGTQLSGMDMNSPVKYVSYIPLVVFLLLTQKEYKDSLGGFMTFGEGFSAGFRYSIFGGLLLAVFMYVYLAVLSPEVLIKSLEASQTQMVAKGMTEAEIEKAMSIAKKFGPVFGAFGIAIFYAIVGAVISLIGAAIFKKEKTAADFVEDPAI